MAMSVVYTNFGGRIVHENRSGTEREYVGDPLGSTVALRDSTLTATDTWEYCPYGEIAARTGSNPTSFTFVGLLGYYKDVLDKLTYVRARYLQPNFGRWLTVDPLWPDEAAYLYVNSSPSFYNDPTGLITQERFKECLEYFIRAFQATFTWCRIATAGILCWACLIGLPVFCIANPALCVAYIWTCAKLCAGRVIACLVAATAVAVAAFFTCLTDEEEKECYSWR